MPQTDTSRRGALGALITAAALLASPGLANAQEEPVECELVGTTGTNEAADALQAAGTAATPEAEAAAYAEAYSALEDELDDDNAAVLLLAAQAKIGLREFDAANALLDQFVQMAPACAQYGMETRFNGWVQLYNVAINAYQDGDLPSALATFEQANAFYPDPRSYTNAALIYLELGDAAKAIETYRAALAAEYHNPDPGQIRTLVTGLGDLLVSEGRVEEALTVYATHLESHPDDLEVRIGYASALADQGRGEESSAIFGDLLSRTDLSATQWVAVGVGLYNAQVWARAAEAFAKARMDNPFNKEAMENLVNASVQAGDVDAVLPLADTLIDWYPYDQNNYQLKASALAKANEDQEAMRVLQEGETTEITFHFVQMGQASSGDYIIQGSLEARGAAGSAVAIPFEFLGAGGQVVATEMLAMRAPPAGETERFELRVASDVPIMGFRYKKSGA